MDLPLEIPAEPVVEDVGFADQGTGFNLYAEVLHHRTRQHHDSPLRRSNIRSTLDRPGLQAALAVRQILTEARFESRRRNLRPVHRVFERPMEATSPMSKREFFPRSKLTAINRVSNSGQNW